MEHAKPKGMSAFDNVNVVSTLQTDHARLVRSTMKKGYIPWIAVLMRELLVSRPVKHQSGILDSLCFKQRQQKPGAKGELSLPLSSSQAALQETNEELQRQPGDSLLGKT